MFLIWRFAMDTLQMKNSARFASSINQHSVTQYPSEREWFYLSNKRSFSRMIQTTRRCT